MTDYREAGSGLRALFCIGVSRSFFDLPAAEIGDVISSIEEAFADLGSRFGVSVLGTLDDDEVMVGPSTTWPWTAYILAEAPDLASVRAVCNVVRESEVGEHRLWRYMRIEARLGRPLFFGNS
jgi:hypothetical protein